jgi:hypothetical protein
MDDKKQKKPQVEKITLEVEEQLKIQLGLANRNAAQAQLEAQSERFERIVLTISEKYRENGAYQIIGQMSQQGEIRRILTPAEIERRAKLAKLAKIEEAEAKANGAAEPEAVEA